jgi:hypothetical protein
MLVMAIPIIIVVMHYVLQILSHKHSHSTLIHTSIIMHLLPIIMNTLHPILAVHVVGVHPEHGVDAGDLSDGHPHHRVCHALLHLCRGDRRTHGGILRELLLQLEQIR